MPRHLAPHHIGVGATEELSLRVSVGTLVSVLFDDPESGQTMLALERTVTSRERDGELEVVIRAKPFGGAARLVNLQALERRIGPFHYDSERSRLEKDFRIQISPASWESIKTICFEHRNGVGNDILDSSPERELAEEFEDSLNVKIDRDDYHLSSRGMIAEDSPVLTSNVRAEGMPTVRVYYLFEARLISPKLIAMMQDNSRRYSDSDLKERARKDYQGGGKGRANAMLTLALDHLKDVFLSISSDGRGEPMLVEGHQLDENVLVILKE